MRRFALMFGPLLGLSVFLSACGENTEVEAPAGEPAADAGELNIYSYRQEQLVRPLLDAFTAETGITVNLLSGKADALLERLKAEGANSPADILLTADVARLERAREAGVLQPTQDAALEALVPAQYRHPDGYWYGLSRRARVIYYAPDRVDPSELSSYEALVDEKWRGRICIRSSSNVYNISLLASLVAHDGAEAAEAWAAGMVANFARKPQGGDTDQIKAVAAGACDLAVGNTYYYGRLKGAEAGSDNRAVADAVGLFWPNSGADGRGAHFNISGAGVTTSSKNAENALKFLSFMASDQAQEILTGEVFEYPIRDDVPVSEIVAGFGPYKADALPLVDYAARSAEAVMIFDRVGWR